MQCGYKIIFLNQHAAEFRKKHLGKASKKKTKTKKPTEVKLKEWAENHFSVMKMTSTIRCEEWKAITSSAEGDLQPFLSA